ncbi:hypothetical protein CSV61_09380 [Sporosarcina sp. P3]|uniref:type II secretion system protein n=1 Tax=Sporosarcina sp. P3 TaxID=2048245 RepID=UPI000C16C6F9|nr:type II secretion system protein [Sporosarcina sp. P3]PID21427.1 hypothetical protein CSV61_09380 [Sporosarcina sp. P3]
MKRKNERGFTLVEILASLTILGIVFISFMTIFPQMSTFNSKTEAKLETINLAKKELLVWRENPLPLDRNSELEIIKEDSVTKPSHIIYDYNYKKEPSFTYRVTLKKEPDLTTTQKGEAELFRIHIIVFKEGREVSETFGYMKKEKE